MSSISDPFDPTPLFSWPLFHSGVSGHETHREGLLQLIHGMRRDEPGVVRSNRAGGWHSGPGFRQCRDPHLGWVLAHVTAYAEQALGPYYNGWKSQRLAMGSYWANVLPAGAYNSPHHHHPQHWSGVYYVSVPEVGSAAADPHGMIEFLQPSPIGSQWGSGSFLFGPRDGHTVLFPSALTHLVHPHAGSDDRVSIAYNFTVVPR